MDLLNKFAAVEIKADNRITEADKVFCEKNQAAYEAAISAHQELGYIWSDMVNQQTELLGDREQPFFHDYLASRNGPSISQSAIDQHIESLHSSLIGTITRYFNESYHVTVSSGDIMGALLPKKPERWDCGKEDLEAYHAKMQALVVRYQDVVDQIILRLDGRSFAERAFQELFDRCHSAAWNSYKHEANFERKKDTIRFNGYFCKYECWGCDRWSLDGSMKDILRGAAHFETGSYDLYPRGLSDLLGYRDLNTDVVTFPTSEKLCQLKMFKNHRVDLKFTSEAYAGEFISKYLGTVC